jgi:hypothetical protein
MIRKVACTALLLGPAAAWAQDNHPISVTADPPSGVQVTLTPGPLHFTAPPPGSPWTTTSSTATAAVAYTASGYSSLSMYMDQEWTGPYGIQLYAQSSTVCGSPNTVALTTNWQPLINLSGNPNCAENVSVNFWADIVSQSTFNPTNQPTANVYYTLF